MFNRINSHRLLAAATAVMAVLAVAPTASFAVKHTIAMAASLVLTVTRGLAFTDRGAPPSVNFHSGPGVTALAEITVCLHRSLGCETGPRSARYLGDATTTWCT